MKHKLNLTAEKVQALCIANNYCTAMDSANYSTMLHNVDRDNKRGFGPVRLARLAQLIKLHSDTAQSVEAIAAELQQAGTEAPAEPENVEYMERPAYNPYTCKGRRAETWFHRSVSAYDLAERLTGPGRVTEAAYNAAFKLLDSCQRYALADAAAWERDNDCRYSGKPWLVKQMKQLEERKKKLQARLNVYGVMMDNYGLYPSIREIDKPGTDLNLLHWFE
ncbi:hypothetical protein J3349_04550 [Faecalibacterium sp. Marseille-P9590]|nr:hypothetical protein [Faecalibacterium sp. Marseille-P9590]